MRPLARALAALALTLAALQAGCAAAPIASPFGIPRAPIRAAEPVTEARPLLAPLALDDTPPAPPPRFREPTAPRERTRVTVLLYHLFGDMASDQSITPERFEAQLTWLREQRIELITAAELASFLEGTLELPANVALLTLDDSHKSTYEKAFPVLKRLGARFTLALNTESIEGRRPEAVTWPAVREMLASGLCELASHSHIHGHMDRLTEARNRSEVTLSREILEQRTGVRPEVFVFPFGGNNEKVRRIVEEAGYRAAFAVGYPAVTMRSPRFQIPRFGVMKTTTMKTFRERFVIDETEARGARGARLATAPRPGGST